MTSATFIRKLFSIPVLAAAASLWLAGCMAGTGTDTENGVEVTARVLGANGAPMAQVEVSVQSVYAGPESNSEDALMPGTGTLHTDSDGYVRFTVKRAGSYMAQGQRGDTVLLIDTLHAGKKDTVVFRTAGVQRLRGKVRLYSGYTIDTGFVFLRGSRISVAVSSTGDYDFGYVPLSADNLTLGAQYHAHPASHAFVKVADAAGSFVVDPQFHLDSNLVPSGNTNLTLLKASQSATNLCLESTQQSVVPGISIRGSLSRATDIMRAATFACVNRVGANIQVDATNLSGNSLQKLGNYVAPDASILPLNYRATHGLGSGSTGQKTVVPIACLQVGTATNFTTSLSKTSAYAEIHVDDIGLESGCEY